MGRKLIFNYEIMNDFKFNRFAYDISDTYKDIDISITLHEIDTKDGYVVKMGIGNYGMTIGEYTLKDGINYKHLKKSVQHEIKEHLADYR